MKSEKKQPKLSIITVNFNNNEGLKDTIKSLSLQTFSDYEHIIIDAGSTDGSKETIIEYASKSPRLSYWVSEPDKGIYDGMNKGIRQANGEYLYFLNSGDLLIKDVLQSIPFDGTKYIYGNIKVIPERGNDWVWKYPDIFDTYFLANKMGWISQQACFIHHSLFENQEYDTSYRIISDWIHAVHNIIFEECSYKHIPLTIVEYDASGISANYERTWEERERWLKEYIPAVFLKSFKELDEFRETELGDIVPLINGTRKFKRRIKKVIIALYRLNSLFSRHGYRKKKIDQGKILRLPIVYDYQIFEMQRYGGISRYFCEIIRRLTYKHQISLLFSINYYLLRWGLGKSRIPMPRFIYKRFRHFFQERNHGFTQRLLKHKRYLFHPTYYDPYFLKHIGDNPYVVTVHDMIHEKFPQDVTDSSIVIEQKKQVLKYANRIIAISENTKKDIVEILGTDPNKIDVIYHSTSMQAFSGKYKLKLPKRFLLFVGDRTPYKNFKRFIEVFACLRQKDKELFVVYTGSRLTGNEREMIAQIDVLDYMIHVKASDRELSELYSRALLFVYPSLYEGFGIPILEAYACHCPIALSNTSCFPEIAGDAAAYFDPYSNESMQSVIAEVIYNEEKRNRLIRLGDERLKRYSWDTAVLLTTECYRKAMEIK